MANGLEIEQDAAPMSTTKAYAAFDPKTPLRPFEVSRREPRADDVVIDIDYCGICHSDLHQVRNEWQNAIYPMVPGHEIVGKVRSVGAKVTKLRPGDVAGVGCMVDSCRECGPCGKGIEQYCEAGCVLTYNGYERDKKTPTFGGYSRQIVVSERFALKVAATKGLEAVAPLLCAGITTYSPLRRFGTGKGKRVGVVGLGGLGHMAVKLAAAMGAEVTLFSSSARKREDAKRLGAHEYVVSSDSAQMAKQAGRHDLIVNTVSAAHDIASLLMSLKLDGTMAMVGAPEVPLALPVFPLLLGRRAIAGSIIGGIAETQEMLDFCAAHKITADIELIPIQQVNDAYARLTKGDVRYRFVIDNSSLDG